MTTSIAVNANNDIFAVNGRLQIATGLDSVLQTCTRVVKVRLGEMRLAQTRGIDYLNDAFGTVNVIKFEASARRQLSSVNRVIAVDSFETTVSNGVLSYTATIRTEFGTGVISV